MPEEQQTKTFTDDKRCTLTPSKCSVVAQAKMIERERPDDERVKVQSFDEHPEEVGYDQVVEQSYYQLAQTL